MTLVFTSFVSARPGLQGIHRVLKIYQEKASVSRDNLVKLCDLRACR
jgi:hypothetical protein